ncbi:MAG: LD-carboxypeptidase [Micromonosporaceae bacterium]|nr:LD-carboxypeptidase [Micromonosporaceae bacterium]
MTDRTPDRRLPHIPTLPRRRLLAGAAAGGALAATSLGESAAAGRPASKPLDVLRPPKLRPGDKVRLVSPAGPPGADAVARGVELLESWGLVVEYAEHALTRYGYLAAPDADRLADLNAAFADPTVRGVLCTRGGYGAQRIIDGIDKGAVRKDPKVLLGFSDITAVQMWLWRNTGLATLHGPMIAWSDSRTGPESAEALRRSLMTTDQIVLHRDPDEPGGSVLVPGQASGVMLGGNVSLLSQAVGARDFPDLHGAILLLEDVGEAPYRLDRMITQLRRSGVLEGLAGIALGQFVDCEGAPDTWTVDEMLHDRLADLGAPVLSGLPIGHGSGQLTIPFGVRATIDTRTGTLTAAPAVR